MAGAGAQRGPWPRPSQLLDRTERWGMAASQQGPPLGARLNTCPQTPGPSDTYWEGAFLQGDEPLAVRQPATKREAPRRTAAPIPCSHGGNGTINRSGKATWVFLGPALLLEESVLEETHNPWSVKKGRMAGLVSFLPIGTSSCSVQYLPVLLKPGIHPDLRRPMGPPHATLRSHDSSSLLPAPAQSWQKPSVAFPPREQRPQGSQGRVDPGTATENHLTPSRHPFPNQLLCSQLPPGTVANHPQEGQGWGSSVGAPPASDP